MATKICVCVKVVPREAVQLRIDPGHLRLDRTGASEVNANDEHAVEEALRLRDETGGEVVVVCMGPADGAESLRSVLAMGADRAVLVADPLLEGSDLVATSRVLAAALGRETPDLVLLGAQASDGGGAMLWAAVAERLGYPALSGVCDVEFTDGNVSGSRRAADVELRLGAPCPCVVALSGAVNTPRYPAFRDVVAARRKEIAVLTAADLGVPPDACGAAGSRTRVIGLRAAPQRRAAGEIITDDGDGAARLLALLGQRGVL
jgi:electron transfer flavoprotein beta subunit